VPTRNEINPILRVQSDRDRIYDDDLRATYQDNVEDLYLPSVILTSVREKIFFNKLQFFVL